LDRNVFSGRGSFRWQSRLRATTQSARKGFLDKEKGSGGDALGSERSSGECCQVSSEKSVQNELGGGNAGGFIGGGEDGHFVTIGGQVSVMGMGMP
jgi:hypothetical protein